MSSRRPLAAASFILVSALALAGCSTAESAPAVEDESSEASTVTYSWERNTAGEDEEPVYETETVEVPVTLRKQRAVVERIDPNKSLGEE